MWKYQGGTWTSLGGVVSAAGITSLAYDDSGNKLYAGTNGGGVWCYNPSDGTWFNVATMEVTTYYITCMAWGGGKLYAGCWNAGAPVGNEGKSVWCYDPATGSWSDTGGGESTFAVTSLAWGGGKLYAGCRNYWGFSIGVWCYDPSNHTWSDTGGGVTGFQIYCLAWSGQKLYAGCRDPNAMRPKGVWCYDPSSGLTDKWSDASGPVVSGFMIYCLARGGGKLYTGCNDWGTGTFEGVWCCDISAGTWSDTAGGG